MYFEIEYACYFEPEHRFFGKWERLDEAFQTEAEVAAYLTPDMMEPNMWGKRQEYRIVRVSQKTGKRRVVAEIFGEGEK